MTKVWSWEEMDYIGEDEPRLLPDLSIPDDTTCAYCNLTEQTSGKSLVVLCSQCGRAAHYACAVDCTPDPYDIDEEYNDFVCGTCLEWTPEDAANHAAHVAADAPTVSPVPLDESFDPSFDDELYPLP
jgi:hypothetical protein